MDPLVRASLRIQRALAASVGTILAVAFAAYLVAWSAEPLARELTLAVLGGFLVSLGMRGVRRLRRLSPDEVTRLDLELALHLLVGVYAAVLLVPGALDGPA